MKMILYYSVDNCGDGSAYPRWFETEELAEWHQEHLDDGWGEPCTGTITVEGDNLKCEKLQSKEGYYLDVLLDYKPDAEDLEKFRAQFFPNGLPEFTVKLINDPLYYGVFVGDRLVYKQFAHPEKKANNKGVKKLQDKLESLTKGTKNGNQNKSLPKS